MYKQANCISMIFLFNETTCGGRVLLDRIALLGVMVLQRVCIDWSLKKNFKLQATVHNWLGFSH